MKKEKNNVNTERTSQINEIQKATIEMLKPIFTKYQATTQEKAMLKDEVIAEVEDKRKAKYSFSYLKQLGIIKNIKENSITQKRMKMRHQQTRI